ncbi:hypothetical protein HID58_011485 [Brassica napus]|uniref:DNA mismatch repair proteins mutS family domain-containing protein n=1 Tax=Brassica napus TaxID=3708 RepID=A0ABQ8DYT2_BRANA|nr:hypothetical protein HID58_011485 [Brassica napus]
MEGNFEETNKLPELKLDAKQAQGFLSFFKTLPNDLRAVRFFDRKDYYTAHGENSVFIAQTYYHTTTALRQIGSGANALSSVSVSKNMFETIVRDLLLERNDHTVELYEGSGSNWRLVKAGSPGNIGSFEDVLFANNEMQDTPVVVSLFPSFQESRCVVGMAYVDLTRRVLGLAEFLDDSRFTNLESSLVAIGAKECIFPAESGKTNECKSLYESLERCGVMTTERSRQEFKGRDLESDLKRLVKGNIEPVRDLISGFELATPALGALLSFSELLSDEGNYGNFTIRRYDIGGFMRLDSAAMRALNVMESKTDANKNFSLFGLMNRTCTAGMGKRLLHMWLKQPLVDLNEITMRLDIVQCFVEEAGLRQDLRQHLKRISDVERLVRSLERRRGGLQHIIKLYQSTIRLPFIKTSLQQYTGEFSSLISKRYIKRLEALSDADHLGKFIDLVEYSVDLDQLENGEYMISSSYDATLSSLKDQKELLEQQIHELHKKTAIELDLPVDKALKLDKAAQYGHVFRITKKEEPKIRKKLTTQFLVLETRKDGVKFTNTKLKKLGDQYQSVVDDYKSCQKELVDRVVQTVASFSEMDVLLSFADLAASCPTPYCRPEVTSSDVGDIVLEGSRHPCVEAQDWVNFIPNDCRLVRGESWFQIITGPNMGGKSTFIRQVGVTVLMAQVGSFVPCDKASVSIRDCIFARVGAGDCQLRGVSTFMQEMLETASILKGATDKSLIIIDELGRGTSTYDGFGLAWAICEHLVQVKKAPTLFATHFHELTALAQANSEVAGNTVGVANFHVSAHIDTESRKLTMLYKVEPGACDQSFGIHVAEFANFPESVVALAREKAAELEDFSPPSIVINNEESGKRKSREDGAEEVSRGAARAHKFLKEFAEMPLDKMELKDSLKRLHELKEELAKDDVGCHWLKQFL